MRTVDGREIRIVRNGSTVTVHYADALAAHGGDAPFGVAITFRMLQAAADALSRDGLWSADDLSIVSAHPGPRLRDVVEHVTGCVSAGRYRLEIGSGEAGSEPGMAFRWRVSDAESTASIALRPDFIPHELDDLLARRGTALGRPDDAQRLATLKWELEALVWTEPLDQLFRVDLQKSGVDDA